MISSRRNFEKFAKNKVIEAVDHTDMFLKGIVNKLRFNFLDIACLLQFINKSENKNQQILV